jgi:hypothetical protein
MDLWSHPTAAKLRESADTSLTVATAALAARQAKLQGKSARAHQSGSPATSASAAGAKAKHGSGHTRSGSQFVRNAHTGDKIRIQLRGAADDELASPAPQFSALKGMNVRGLRQQARTLGVDEENITTAVEGSEPKKALISLIQIIQAKEGLGSLAEPTAAGDGVVSAALKDMSVRSLLIRGRKLGLNEAVLTATVEGANPHSALSNLIQAMGAPAGCEQTAAGGISKQAPGVDPLDTLPAMLRAALGAVAAVETPGGDEISGRGGIIGKQLNRMKQTYLADLSAALVQVEGALDGPSAIAVAKSTITDGESGDAAGAESGGREVSPLENMKRELLQDLLLGPLPVATLAAVSQTCKGLLVEVRSPEMQNYWKAHWTSRWGDSEHKGVDGRDLPVTAEAFGQRANLEMAWRITRWSPAVETPNTVGVAAAIEVRMPLRSTVACSAALLCAPQHEVRSIGFDQTRGHCVTGDTDGLVRVWDVAKCVHAASTGEQMDKECRLGVHRLHHKGALHDQRSMCTYVLRRT